jgi:molybdopterin converting factor small subunit
MFFAQLKDAMGADTELLDVAESQTVADVMAAIRTRDAWAAVANVPLTFAVNERIVPDSHRLADGDRLALLAPVSGG